VDWAHGDDIHVGGYLLGIGMSRRKFRSGLIILLVAIVALNARDKKPSKSPRKIPQIVQTGKPRSIRLAPRWDPVTGRLSGVIKPLDLERGNYFKGRFDQKGRLERVVYFDENRTPVYEYRLNRDEDGLYRSYSIEFFQDGQLTTINSELIASDLSVVKKGWTVRVTLNTGYLPKRFEVLDGQGIRYYFYTISYPKATNIPGERLVVSEYFRSDSTRIGSRELVYRSGEGLIMLTIRDGRNHILRQKRLERDYTNLETMVTVTDSTGRVLERRIQPGLE